MEITVVDVETTGMGDDAEVCQLGWTEALVEGEQVDFRGPHQTFLKPRRPIEVEAMAIHHISDAMVANCPPSAPFIEDFCDHRRGAIFCAHNAAFEQRWLDRPDTRWICTLKGARRIWPDAPSHTNQVLRYWLGHPVDAGLASPPHHAGPDSLVTAHTLAALLKITTIEKLIQWSSEPSLLPRFHFGKHAGVPLAEVPADYLQWMSRQADMDPDVLHTARHELERRASM